MRDEKEVDPSVEQAEVQDLLERRRIVQGWLDRLDDQHGSVSDRVLHRVREDYDSRLQDILNALASHRQLVQEELDGAARRLADAEHQHSDAVDQLEEDRLRNAIGELDDDTWDERSRRLDDAVRQAEERQQRARSESDRLRELLDQLDERTVDSPATTPFATPDLVPEESAEAEIPPEPEGYLDSERTEAGEEEDLSTFDPESETFLEQIDKALTERPTDAPTDESDEPEEDTAPKPGLKCGECGYTNDLSAWFCGVCGADVG